MNSYAKDLFKKNYIEYASYVIKERAIPDIMDGLKPVQRRIIHTLIELDDGRFHKVANVVGRTMSYHPHGDASIYSALVNLANCNLLIEGQGNFGNFMTGDNAAAARYIECRLMPIAKKILYNPELTEFVDSYDSRSKEPVRFQAKIPILVIQGTDGIAPGMTTRILPHNFIEVIDALEKALKGENVLLYPDFPGGGIVDVSDYKDGCGTVTVRAKLNTNDPKKIYIEELPFGVTSEQMINSIENAVKKDRLKVNSISDYTAEKVSIEISLSKNTYSNDIVDALYAYTLCEEKVSCFCLVIQDKYPLETTISNIISFHSKHLIDVLQGELNLQIGHLNDRLHSRTLERIFIEERIYKRIEQKRSQEAINKSIVSGFEPYKDSLIRELSSEDIERLLKIPIRRISLFDMEKNKEEIDIINQDIEKAKYHLDHIIDYAMTYLEEIKKMAPKELEKRKTKISDFDAISVREVAQRDKILKYDSSTGYVGYDLKNGSDLLEVSVFDKVLFVSKNGDYVSMVAPDKFFIGTSLSYCNYSDKDILSDVVFSIFYQEKKENVFYIKRAKLGGLITNKIYSFLPEKTEKDEDYQVRRISIIEDGVITAKYKKGFGYKKIEENFYFSDFLVKNPKARGVRVINNKQLSSFSLRACTEGEKQDKLNNEKQDEEIDEKAEQPSLFDED
ncbi:MAG: DNA topoisomerase IV subunit A [Sphaerochaetaceae bacterium]|nr:DNA topoisomerase IV subunit A [Sphaerochaetaceae bacterium]